MISFSIIGLLIIPTEPSAPVGPGGLALTLAMGILLLVVPRKWAPIPLAVVTCYTTFGQHIMIGGMNFYMLRLLILFGFVRLLLKHEARNLTWLRIDTAVLLWATISVVAYVLLWQSQEALVNALGYAYDALGLYFLSRSLIRDIADIQRLCKIFAIMLLPLAIALCFEKATGINPFYLLGGVPKYTEIRDGALRCQGPFRHPILTGCFGAVWLPLFVGLWLHDRRSRMFAVLGIACSSVITVMSASSGPVGSYLVAVVGLLMFPLRTHMRKVRWATVAAIAALDIIMKDPVWFIFARFSFFSGSTGWHRSWLIDRTIHNFSDWWLVGTKSVEAWGVFAGDVTNQFIAQGTRAGLIVMFAFIWIVILAFRQVGLAVRRTQGERGDQFLVWAVGCSVLAHFVNFWNVSYFDQNVVNWYLALAMSAAAFTIYCRRPRPVMNVPEADGQQFAANFADRFPCDDPDAMMPSYRSFEEPGESLDL